jgi:ATP phosphoribosyltransferase
MHIEYSIRNVYGSDRLYPENSWAELMCDITGSKTISRRTLDILEDAGIECERVMGE